MRDNWTDKLPSLMEGHQEAPPEGLWDAVQAGANRPKLVWWPWAASLAAAAAVVLAVFLWKPSGEPATSPVLLDVPRERVAQAEVAAEEQPGEALPVKEEKPASYAGVHRAPVLHTEPENSAVGVQEEAVLHTEEQETLEEQPEVPEKEPETPPEEPVLVPEEPMIVPETPVVWPEEPVARGKKAGRGKISVTSGGALLAQAVTSTSQGYGVAYNPGMDTPAPIVKSDISAQMLSRNRPSTTEASHRQLLRMSLGVNYEFAPRWSVGSGLTYSILRSDYTTVSGTTESRSTRRLYYLGLSLNVQYKLLEWKRLSLYLSAGPMLETAVGANLKTLTQVSGIITSQQTDPVTCKDWRWSLNAGAGLQLQLFGNTFLFVQPDISWHIPNNNSVESFYTARPLAFALDFGLRWNL